MAGDTDTMVERRGGALKVGWLVSLLVLFWVRAGKADAMARMCLFSAVRGVVLDHGQPVEGATIERSYKWLWKDQRGGDRTATDANGEFALPSIWGRSLLGRILPHEPMVEQTILIHHAGQTYRAWVYTRGNYDEDSELDGRGIKLQCRLEAEPAHHGAVYGMCDLVANPR